MSQLVTIPSITANTPVNVYYCDNLAENCVYVGTTSSFPYSFTVPTPYDSQDYIIKILDSLGCVIQNFIYITPTPTVTPFLTPTQTPTNTKTPGLTPTPTKTTTPTPTQTPTSTMEATPTRTPHQTPGLPCITPSSTPTQNLTPTQTPTNTETPTNTPSETPTQTPNETQTQTPSETPTQTPTPSETPTNTPSETPTQTPTQTSSETPTQTPSETPTNTPTNTETPTQTPTNTSTNTGTPTQTPTNTETPTNTPSRPFVTLYVDLTTIGACSGGGTPVPTFTYSPPGTSLCDCTSISGPNINSGSLPVGSYFVSDGINVRPFDKLTTFGSLNATGPCTTCPVPTPTSTQTPTITQTPTQTTTPTNTSYTVYTNTDSCGVEQNPGGGGIGVYYYEITGITTTGNITFDYNALTVPDRFIVSWNGITQIDTGFVSFCYPSSCSTYDAQLNALGYPSVSGSNGTTTFNKTASTPSSVFVTVIAPLTGTAWSFTVSCS